LHSPFDVSQFQQQLNTQWLGQSFCYFEELESTNTYLKKLPADEVKQGMICLTDHQTKGRGQYDRKWKSEKQQNLTFSLAFRPPSTGRFHVLTLACALALVEYCNNLMDSDSCSYIKWPNDVFLSHKKIAGLLTESVFSGNTFDRLIIGIGLNVNQQAFTDPLQDIATSIRLEMGGRLNREQLLCNLLKRIEYKYNLWQRKQETLVKTINRSIRGYGQWVQMNVDGILQDESYKLLGINEQGKLLMLDHDGKINSYSYEQIQLITD
jgi:BirA family biotin operon repressor/biotin-[acetyl-CoA-carboxylase] ligase